MSFRYFRFNASFFAAIMPAFDLPRLIFFVNALIARCFKTFFERQCLLQIKITELNEKKWGIEAVLSNSRGMNNV